MRRIRLLTVALAGMLVLGVMAFASMASAVELKDPTGILPNPTAVKPVTFEIAQVNEGTLETLSGKKVKCAKLKGSGEAKELKLGTITLTFEGCKDEVGAECIGLAKGEAKETIVTKGEFHVVWGLLKNAFVPAITVLPEHTHFTCGFGLVLVLVLGCVAGWVLSTDKLVKEFELHFQIEEKTKGDPDIPEFKKIGELKEEKCQLLTSVNEGAEESSAILQLVKLKGFKQGGVSVEALLMYLT
jgi:hypothetical protein